MTADAPAGKLMGQSVSGFVAALASDEPSPGGGSASAVAAAMGAALCEMVAGVTVGKERYADVEAQMQELRQRAAPLRQRALELADADAAAYARVVEAMRMPRSTDREKAERTRAMQEAFRGAAEAPMLMAEVAVEIVELAIIAAESGNKNASSDAVVAALLGHAALYGARQNVLINLDSIRDAAYGQEARSKLAGLARRSEAARQRVLAAVNGAAA